MIPFSIARENHSAVEAAACEDVSAASQLWECLTEGVDKDPRAAMLLETLPDEYAVVVRTDEIAASYALSRIFPAYIGSKTGLPLRDAFRKGWEAFDNQAKTANDLSEGFGWDRSSSWQNYRELVGSDVDTASVSRIAKLSGRMYAEIRGGSKRTIVGIPAEICDVSLGSDLSKILPTELGYMAMGGEIADLAYLRLVSNTALQFETKGEEETSKGPLILMNDESGSMHGPRHEWAAAAMIAIARVAKDEHRQVAVVHFSTSVLIQELDSGNPEDIAKLIKSHLSGGTDIAQALRAAHRKAVEWRKVGKFADAVLITDGVDEGAGIPAAVSLLLTECRLWSVAIGEQIPVGNPLRDLAAEYVYLSGSAKDFTGEIGIAGAVSIGKAAL